MRSIDFVVHDESELDNISTQIIAWLGNIKVVAFYGAMGAGKTTLISSICKQLGAVDRVHSPTFSIVNEYLTEDSQTIFHFDFYRIKSIAEAYDMGFENYLDSNHLCLIEWPENVKGLLNIEKANIFISLENSIRKIHCSYE